MKISAIVSLLLLSITLCVSCKDQTEENNPIAPEGMVYLKGGSYTRGSEGEQDNGYTYKEEAPSHKAVVAPFFIDATEVTNAQFKKFVDATGYVTFAEKGLTKEDFPHAPPAMLEAGAGVFTPTNKEINPYRHNAAEWWPFIPGANWKHPQGPDSSIEDIMNHPVVCVNYDDAAAYAKWAGKRLPTEAEWEFAARGGLKEQKYAWGDKIFPGKWMANVYQGSFPHKNSVEDGFALTAPVKSFPPNGYGLYDMSGNVWELCSGYYSPNVYQQYKDKEAVNPQGSSVGYTTHEISLWQGSGKLVEPPADINPKLLTRIKKGGSFLCNAYYCLRYRPAARHYSESITPTNHTGFRCVQDIPQEKDR